MYKPPTKEVIKEKIEFYADKYEVSAELMDTIVSCETAGTYQYDIQSYATYKSGLREKSYGVAQIHLPDWPDITYAQAIDPDFALDFLAKKLSEGKGKLWSCYPK